MVDIPEHLLIRSAEARAKALGITVDQALAEMKGEAEPTVISKEPDVQVIDETPAPAAETPAPAATKKDTPEEVEFAPEVKVTQRLLTVVKAKPIQKPVSEPVDKVNTWPHLMLPEFVSLMAMTAFLILLSAILQAPLLEEANPNVTPNPAKAPWYFLGLQELLSYWDPQIAGVMIPLLLGVVLWMAFPYIDRNPETHPSKRKFVSDLSSFNAFFSTFFFQLKFLGALPVTITTMPIIPSKPTNANPAKENSIRVIRNGSSQASRQTIFRQSMDTSSSNQAL